MNSPHMEVNPNGKPPSFWRRPTGLAVITAVLIVGFYLLREHMGHLLGLWPYLLLAACPLMHLMHGHGHHGHGSHGTPGLDHSPEKSDGR